MWDDSPSAILREAPQFLEHGDMITRKILTKWIIFHLYSSSRNIYLEVLQALASCVEVQQMQALYITTSRKVNRCSSSLYHYALLRLTIASAGSQRVHSPNCGMCTWSGAFHSITTPYFRNIHVPIKSPIVPCTKTNRQQLLRNIQEIGSWMDIVDYLNPARKNRSLNICLKNA